MIAVDLNKKKASYKLSQAQIQQLKNMCLGYNY